MKPFRINVPETVLTDLRNRLTQTRWTDEPADAGWGFGMDPGYLHRLLAYWQDGFDWRKQEALLNALPQFTATVDEVTLHFVYVKGKGAATKPLILTHEWPDSFFRFYKVIPLLSDAGFDVVVPSMPGHGFSERKSVPSGKTAALFGKLMTDVLHYPSFFASGDWAVTKGLALQYPAQVKAIYLTDTGYPNGTEDWSALTPAEQAFGQTIQRWFFAEGAFNMIQSTKPQTLGYGLNDSPAGLASWIGEKLHGWSDHANAGISMDEVLTNVMIYWATQTINTSIRRYAEDTRALYAHGYPVPDPRIETPTGLAVYPADSDTPREWAERRANVVHYVKMPRGGRFAALEVPELWAADVVAFFNAR
jgi:microsomal epoxide hydrolase